LKKSIAFVLPNLNAGGAERVVCTLANLLVKEFNVTVISLYRMESFYKLNPEVNLCYCSKTYNPNPSIFQSITNHYKLSKNLIKILKSKNIDLVIGFLPVTNIYAIVASKFLRIPNIISERANPEYSTLNKFWAFVRKKVYPFSNCLVVQTEANKNYFEPYVKTEIRVINNPINLDILKKKDPSKLKENIILNVGRLAEPKNQDLLIRAFSNIKKPEWQLILVGDGVNYNKYNDLIYSLGMENQIVLVGNISDVSTYYNKTKIFAFTSKYEGFPNVILEAMSFGIACISTNCPHGPSEIIENNINGILIPVGNQKMLEQSLTKLMTNKGLRESLGDKAQKSTLAYHPINIVKEWTELINKLTNN